MNIGKNQLYYNPNNYNKQSKIPRNPDNQQRRIEYSKNLNTKILRDIAKRPKSNNPTKFIKPKEPSTKHLRPKNDSFSFANYTNQILQTNLIRNNKTFNTLNYQKERSTKNLSRLVENSNKNNLVNNKVKSNLNLLNNKNNIYNAEETENLFMDYVKPSSNYTQISRKKHSNSKTNLKNKKDDYSFISPKVIYNYKNDYILNTKLTNTHNNTIDKYINNNIKYEIEASNRPLINVNNNIINNGTFKNIYYTKFNYNENNKQNVDKRDSQQDKSFLESLREIGNQSYKVNVINKTSNTKNNNDNKVPTKINFDDNKENSINNINDLPTPKQPQPEFITSGSEFNLEENINEKTVKHHKASKENQQQNQYSSPSNIFEGQIELIFSLLVGLNNLGQTCFMNSALQNIIHCKIFIKKLFEQQEEIKQKMSEKPITYYFIDLCLNLALTEIKYTNNKEKILKNKNYYLCSFPPKDFLQTFRKKHKCYDDCNQQDSIEFLRNLLDDISKELNINNSIPEYKELSTENKTKIQQNDEYNNFYLSRENSIIINIFYNQIINVFTCECGYESYSFEKLLDIPLLLPTKQKDTDFLSLINDHFKEEEIEWGTECPKCKLKNVKHKKRSKFSMLPDVIIFSIQRLNPYLQIKSNVIVKFEETIDLKDFCDDELLHIENNNDTKYNLFGTINHIGAINFGHYYSYIKIKDEWNKFNDAKVNPEPKLMTESPTVCVLFFEKASL